MATRPALLVLVRHAESARNQAKQGSVYFADDAARRVLRGIPDHEIPLTADGHQQALQTGVALRERAGQKVMAVTHGQAIRCFRFVLEQPSFRQGSPFPKEYDSSNCGVTAYAVAAAGDQLELIDANQVYWTVGQPEDGGV